MTGQGLGGQSHLQPSCSWRILVCAEQGVYTALTPFLQSESEKILLQDALRTQRCKQLFFHCSLMICSGSGGSVEPRCGHSWGARPAALCKNNTGEPLVTPRSGG